MPAGDSMKKDRTGNRISLSMVMALIVTMLVLAVLLATLLFFSGCTKVPWSRMP